MVSVVVADRQPLFLDGLARVIRQDAGLRLAGAFDQLAAAVAAIELEPPDVALLELESEPPDGLPTRVLLLTAGGRPDLAYDALARGACGGLSKRVGPEAIRDAVRRVARGESVLCPELQSAVAGEIQVREGGRELLSPRQREILCLMARGLSTVEIAPRLHLAASTVKTHQGQVYDRLGVRDRAAAVAEGMRRGLIH